MICFPYYKDLQKTAGVENNFDKFKKGNFGLWYNKFIPVNKDDYKPFVEKKDKNQVVEDET
ncbi:MAG: hypothetical protein U9Q97_08550, partial [Acidobacteriota bacterium]|nr:hypothetical protein [Acidobacteriota bacterium]